MLDLSLLPDGGASWLDASGEHADIIISTRIRLARNLEGYAFTPRARDGERLRILTQVREAFASLRSIEDGVLVRVDELVDAFVDGEEATHAEQNEGHDEAPEEPLAAEAEGVLLGRLAPGPAAAEEQQALVAGVGDRVDPFGQHRRRAGDGEGHELGQGDPEVGQEGGGDGPGRPVAVVGGAHGDRR